MLHAHLFLLQPVAYGWSSDILGFVVESVTGQSLETYLYVQMHYISALRKNTHLKTVTVQGGKHIEAIEHQGHILFDTRSKEEAGRPFISTRWQTGSLGKSSITS